MTEVKDNSSLPLLLSITGAVLVVAVGGWFLLDQDPPSSPASPPVPVVAPTANATDVAAIPPETTIGETAADDVEAAIADGPKMENVVSSAATESPDDDAELRKARLAADADILVFPADQSALYYYGRVLSANPQNEVASAELDTILTKVAQTVSLHLEAEEYDEAHAIAVLVAELRPEHSLVVETQQTLDSYTEELVAEAIQHAQDGNDSQANDVMATAEGLPGRNPSYFVAVRDSITEIRDARQAAERDRAQRSRLAANQARAAWVESVRQAIVQGNLIEPAGASARDLLAERNSWSAERSQLTGELLNALTEAAQSRINNERLDGVEPLLSAAAELGGDAEKLEDIRASLERALIEAKSSQVAQLTELVQVKKAPIRYPRRAMRQNLTGWVEVLFTVTPNGKTADIEINNAEPETVFNDAAIAAVSDWEFEPVEYRGQLISQRAGARLVFRLE